MSNTREVYVSALWFSALWENIFGLSFLWFRHSGFGAWTQTQKIGRSEKSLDCLVFKKMIKMFFITKTGQTIFTLHTPSGPIKDMLGKGESHNPKQARFQSKPASICSNLSNKILISYCVQ